MLPSNPGGHSAYQKFVLDSFREYYPDYDSLHILKVWFNNIIEARNKRVPTQ